MAGTETEAAAENNQQSVWLSCFECCTPGESNISSIYHYSFGNATQFGLRSQTVNPTVFNLIDSGEPKRNVQQGISRVSGKKMLRKSFRE